jgi:hypothetical protein
MTQHLKKITPEYMADVERYPAFTAAVQAAKDYGSRPTIEVSLEQFNDDPFGLYACLWYAWSDGVHVMFAAPKASAMD